MKTVSANVDEYISGFPPATRAALEQIRETIRAVVPDAEEYISYAIPSYRSNGGLVSFAGYAKHIGFYPGAGAVAEFKSELTRYKHAKGSIQFPLGEALPRRLISRIVRFRVKQNLEKMKKGNK